MPPVSELPAVAALAALLVVAYRHPRPAVEAGVSVLAVLVAVAPAVFGADLLGWAGARDTVERLGPVVAFLMTILVVSVVCERAGVFDAVAALLRRQETRLFTVSFLVAAVVTVVLSLDATVVLLTPVVVTAAIAAGVSHRPHAYACLRMANSASLLLPISNLTNLLALHQLDVGFAGFALIMAPVFAAVLVVEYLGLRWYFGPLPVPRPRAARPDDVPLPRFPVAVVGLMLLAFAGTSPFDVPAAVISTVAAVVLVAWAARRGLMSTREVVDAAHPGFALFVLALGLVVAVLTEGWLGARVAEVLPTSTSFAALLGICLLATLLANLLTNLSATLLLVPLLAPLGDTAILAALVGLNVGAGLTLGGSLANLLWRRGLARQGHPEGLAAFHRLSLLLTPPSLLVGVAVLALVA